MKNNLDLLLGLVLVLNSLSDWLCNLCTGGLMWFNTEPLDLPPAVSPPPPPPPPPPSPQLELDPGCGYPPFQLLKFERWRLDLELILNFELHFLNA